MKHCSKLCKVRTPRASVTHRQCSGGLDCRAFRGAQGAEATSAQGLLPVFAQGFLTALAGTSGATTTFLSLVASCCFLFLALDFGDLSPMTHLLEMSGALALTGESLS